MALNPPPLKLYNSARLTLNNIYEFAKGQGYTVSTFCSKTDKQVPPTVHKCGFSMLKEMTIIRPLGSAKLALV
jgi:hypothetical protein